MPFLYFLIAILIPRFWSVETGLLMLIAATLIGRSVSDIWMIQNATVVESTIIHMNREKFKTALLKYLAALPAVSLSLERDKQYYIYYIYKLYIHKLTI